MQRVRRLAIAYRTVFEYGLPSCERGGMCKIGLIKTCKGVVFLSNTNYYVPYEDNTLGFFKVVFVNNTTGDCLVRGFDSLWLCNKFVQKCKRSKKVTLVSYPYFA